MAIYFTATSTPLTLGVLPLVLIRVCCTPSLNRYQPRLVYDDSSSLLSGVFDSNLISTICRFYPTYIYYHQYQFNRRMSEVGRRRFLLNQWYNLATLQGKEDPSMKFELQKFLLVTRELHDIHEIFLTKCPSGLLNGLQAKRLRTGLAPFLMDSLVCVQVGNYHWSEECLGLTVGDLIFVKHSNRLRGAVRLCLPLNTILSGMSYPCQIYFMSCRVVSFYVLSTFALL